MQYLKEKLLKIVGYIFRFFKDLKDKFSKLAKKNNKLEDINNSPSDQFDKLLDLSSGSDKSRQPFQKSAGEQSIE